MRTLHYQNGERLAGATESFGRIARSAPADFDLRTLARIGGIDAGMVRQSFTPSAYALHTAARADRSARIGTLIGAMARWLGAHLERLAERRCRRAVERATFDALSALDSRTLRDLGIGQGEVRSVAVSAGRYATLFHFGAASANSLRLF